MFEMLKAPASLHPLDIAYDFFDTRCTYKDFLKGICILADAFTKIEIKKGDHVIICLPNCPQALYAVYALNKIGAIAVMVHPLSSSTEIEFCINDTKAKAMLVLNNLYGVIRDIECTKNVQIIITSLFDEVRIPDKYAYQAIETWKNKARKTKKGVLKYKDLKKLGTAARSQKDIQNKMNARCKGNSIPISTNGHDIAIIMYTGGTTGKPKGVMLTNNNINAAAIQMLCFVSIPDERGAALSVLPIFHGYGLVVTIHCPLITACTCVLLPRFSPKTFSKIMKKKKIRALVGVPTMYEIMLNSKYTKNIDLSSLIIVITGGDILKVDQKKRIDAYLKQNHCEHEIREGYGTTECVTASCFQPEAFQKEGSVGIPLQDMYYKIVHQGTTIECEYCQIGEICISGPTLMQGYLNDQEATDAVLKIHEDKRLWFHTGDLGKMDSDGFVYFVQRIDRVIVSSGYNINPSQIEEILNAHPIVESSCVVGEDDAIKSQKIVAYIVLKKNFSMDEKIDTKQDSKNIIKQEIISYLKSRVSQYSLPEKIVFLEEMPLTKYGKIAYNSLSTDVS